MTVHHHNNGGAGKNDSSAAQLKAAAEILEKAVGNRALLAELSEEERTRLLTAAGAIYCPDVKRTRLPAREGKGAAAQSRENPARPESKLKLKLAFANCAAKKFSPRRI